MILTFWKIKLIDLLKIVFDTGLEEQLTYDI